MLLCATTWNFRFVQICSSFPLLLLVLVEKAAHLICERRKTVAALLLATDNAELRRNQDDFAVKTKALFRDELKMSADAGRCCSNLFSFMVMVRSQLTGESQCIEGRNSILQIMSKRAPRMQHPLANARTFSRAVIMKLNICRKMLR